jgi:hypothetical protein
MHCIAPKQLWQAPPSRPHVMSCVPLTQVMPPKPWAQQPAQVVESQTHRPCTHFVPSAHWPPMPQAHRPLLVHASARVASQVTHAPPCCPHCVSDRIVSQTPFAQHPIGQFCALQLEQTPLVHMPLPQLTHALPRSPQVVAEVVSHVLPLQQPFGHEFRSQTHWPRLLQAVPAGHGGPLPHAHCPVAEQRSVVSMSQRPHAAPGAAHAVFDSRMHVGPEQQPIGQLVAVQLLQTPPEQVPPSHEAHWRPLAPHAAESLPSSQVLPLQQPEQLN